MGRTFNVEFDGLFLLGDMWFVRGFVVWAEDKRGVEVGGCCDVVEHGGTVIESVYVQCEA
jgi:hypothetical protein